MKKIVLILAIILSLIAVLNIFCIAIVASNKKAYYKLQMYPGNPDYNEMAEMRRRWVHWDWEGHPSYTFMKAWETTAWGLPCFSLSLWVLWSILWIVKRKQI